MRLAFMGTPDFAVPALRALLGAGHDIVAVYSQPPRPAGRGQGVRPSPVQMAAEAAGLPVRTPTRLRANAEEHETFAAMNLDAAVVVAYGLILPPAMLHAPRRGCLNIHASLLPRWRGAAPIQAAILAGDAETGVTIMRMDAGLDTGPMILSAAVPITAQTTASSLHDTLAALGARLIGRALAEGPPEIPQPAVGATYAAKLERAHGRLDFSRDATALDRQIRALNPWPGTFCQFGEVVLKVQAAVPVDGVGGPPGTVLDDALTVACGPDAHGKPSALRLTRVQAPGRAAMNAAAFLRGHKLPAGTVLS